MSSVDRLVHDERTNAAFGWTLTGVVALAAVAAAVSGDPLWAGFGAGAVGLISLPALWARNWRVLVPWPPVLFVAGATAARAYGVAPDLAGYLAIATVALVAVVELDVVTPVDMSRRFAAGFAVLTTMALQALWTVAQFVSDRWLGTRFLTTQTELQWDFVFVTAAGLAVGGVFQWYFERSEHVGSRASPVDSLSR
jgi:hypothetical protein